MVMVPTAPRTPPLDDLIILIGLPGGGKSTVGKQLARRLGVDFVDSDSVLEDRIGMPIRSFFELYGEEAFRDREEQVIEELTRPLPDGAGRVLATGGGAVLRANNRQHLKARGTVVYLRSSPDELFRRLRHDTQRPLLQVADPLARLRDLHAVRHPLYEETAHLAVDTGRPSVSNLVHQILDMLDERPPSDGMEPAPPAP